MRLLVEAITQAVVAEVENLISSRFDEFKAWIVRLIVSKEELKSLLAEMIADKTIVKKDVAKHYRTRAKITLERAVEITGFAKRTIQNLLKDPRNTQFPGLNVEENILLKWALVYKGEKVKKHWANMANHPIPLSSLPPMLQKQLGFATEEE